MPEIQDMSLKYGGKVLVIHIVLNTDQDHYHLAKSLRRAARGPHLDALLMWIEGYDGEAGREAWTLMQTTTTKIAADSRSTHFHDGGE
jgi:hypothetical protein